MNLPKACSNQASSSTDVATDAATYEVMQILRRSADGMHMTNIFVELYRGAGAAAHKRDVVAVCWAC